MKRGIGESVKRGWHQLEIGNLELEIGNWEFGIGNWKLGIWKPMVIRFASFPAVAG